MFKVRLIEGMKTSHTEFRLPDVVVGFVKYMLKQEVARIEIDTSNGTLVPTLKNNRVYVDGKITTWDAFKSQLV